MGRSRSDQGGGGGVGRSSGFIRDCTVPTDATTDSQTPVHIISICHGCTNNPLPRQPPDNRPTLALPATMKTLSKLVVTQGLGRF